MAIGGVTDTTNVIIPIKLLLQAKVNRVVDNQFDKIYIGVDVARFGDDSSVIYYRHGNKVYEPISLKANRVDEIADKIIELCGTLQQQLQVPDVIINVDETGIGGGVVDCLIRNRLPYMKVNGINFASRTITISMMI